MRPRHAFVFDKAPLCTGLCRNSCPSPVLQDPQRKAQRIQSPKSTVQAACSSYRGVRTENPQLILKGPRRAEAPRPRCAGFQSFSFLALASATHLEGSDSRQEHSGPGQKRVLLRGATSHSLPTRPKWPMKQRWAPMSKQFANPKFSLPCASERSHLELQKNLCRPDLATEKRLTGVGARTEEQAIHLIRVVFPTE